MTKNRNSGRVLIWIAGIVSLLTMVFQGFLAIALACNFWGIADMLIEMMMSAGYTDAVTEINFMSFEAVLGAVVNLYFAIFYIKLGKLRVSSRQHGRMMINKSIWQILIGSALPGVIALIAGVVLNKPNRSVAHVTAETTTESDISEFKLQAMNEAVARLKELKERGAISEEEYYANLNKILEGY